MIKVPKGNVDPLYGGWRALSVGSDGTDEPTCVTFSSSARAIGWGSWLQWRGGREKLSLCACRGLIYAEQVFWTRFFRVLGRLKVDSDNDDYWIATFATCFFGKIIDQRVESRDPGMAAKWLRRGLSVDIARYNH